MRKNLNEEYDNLKDIIILIASIVYFFGLSSIFVFQLTKLLMKNIHSKLLLYKLITFNIGLLKNKRYGNLYKKIKDDIFNEFKQKIDNQHLLQEVKEDLDNIIFLVDNIGVYMKKNVGDGIATLIFDEKQTVRVLFVKPHIKSEEKLATIIKHELRHHFGDIIGSMPLHYDDDHIFHHHTNELINNSFDLNQIELLKNYFEEVKKDKKINPDISFGDEDIYGILGALIEKFPEDEVDNFLLFFTKYIIVHINKYKYLFSAREMYPRLLSLYDDLRKYNNSKKINLYSIISLVEKIDKDVLIDRDYFIYLFFINYKEPKFINDLVNKLAIDYEK